MNIRYLFGLLICISSTIWGMDPRIRAKISQYKREQAEEERMRQAQQEKTEQSGCMTLNNGYTVSLSFF